MAEPRFTFPGIGSQKSSLAGLSPMMGGGGTSFEFPPTLESEMEMEAVLATMEKGHKVCRIALGRRWEPSYRRLAFLRETRQLIVSKVREEAGKATKPLRVDIRSVKEVQTLDYRTVVMKVMDRWRRDKDLAALDPAKILIIHHGSSFTLHLLLFLFETAEAARVWQSGLRWLSSDIMATAHPLRIERWLRKEFYAIANLNTSLVTMKQMKPFVHTRLQYKIASKALQELVDEQMGFEQFAQAYRKLIHLHSLMSSRFADYADENRERVPFDRFIRFISIDQNEPREGDADLDDSFRENCSDFLRAYVASLEAGRDSNEPYLLVSEFLDLLFSRENTLWVGDDEDMQDMTRPLSHYWIASSHNTYLTGDQLRSDSSLEAYSRALLMGCRCIELDCWDGQRRGKPEGGAEALSERGGCSDVVIYHGYTMTTKLALRDVLLTIRQYAFTATDLPLILSIEDNCSVSCQRVMAADLTEILGDFLVTAPVDKEETALPSPHSLRRRIILKHKKLPTESEKGLVSGSSLSASLPPPTPGPAAADDDDADILNREDFHKKGVLLMHDPENGAWSPHLFMLFDERLYYTEAGDSDGRRRGMSGTSLLSDGNSRQESIANDDDGEMESGMPGVKPEEMHITEEWFHGRISREDAGRLLKTHGPVLGDGLFLVRESNTFIGDFSLSFWFRTEVHHCRIRTKMVEGEKKFYFLEPKTMDTLFELISFYTQHALATPKFRTPLRTACPQPNPHEAEPWFLGRLGKAKAEELLNAFREDGAFLLRYSSGDHNVFVLSMRVDGAIWHMRLKREGRIFLVNQTIFENLCLLVKYYQEHQLFRGVCLKFPVNEETICAAEIHGISRLDILTLGDALRGAARRGVPGYGREVAKYCHADATFTPEGCYLDLAGVDSESQARAIMDHNARDPEQLSFSAGDVLSVMKKTDNGMWFGRTSGRSGWFDSQAVKVEAGGSGDGRDAAASVALAGCTIEKASEEGRPFVLCIRQAKSHWDGLDLRVAAASEEEREEWINTLLDLTNQANDKVSRLRSKEKEARIAAVLSAMVVYCQAVPFTLKGAFYEMCSFSETKLDKLLGLGLALFNLTRLSRVYPNAARVTSANFNPIPMWNAGVHMVALNYQTPDRAMQLNQGRFLGNRSAGYILKPAFMMEPGYEPDKAAPTGEPAKLTIAVIAGRHLCRRDRTRGGIVSPFVEVEVVGMPSDNHSYRTKTISSNGFNPVWEEVAEFTVAFPEAALLRFYVEDGDFVGPGTDPFVGQLTIPLSSIRSGYRSVPLRNEYSEELELASILVHIEYRANSSNLPRMTTTSRLVEADAALMKERANKTSFPRRKELVGSPSLDESESVDDSEATYYNTTFSSPTSSTASEPAPRKKTSSAGKLKQFFKISVKKDG